MKRIRTRVGTSEGIVQREIDSALAETGAYAVPIGAEVEPGIERQPPGIEIRVIYDDLS